MYENQCKKWITQGIKIPCKPKRELYLKCRNSNNIDVKRHYQAYARILCNVIKEAKRQYYDKKIAKSSFVIKLFSTKELTSIIETLKSKNTYWYDEISIKVLKLSANYICSPLTYICNKS